MKKKEEFFPLRKFPLHVYIHTFLLIKRHKNEFHLRMASISAMLGPHQLYPGIFRWFGAINVFFLMSPSVVSTLAMSYSLRTLPVGESLRGTLYTHNIHWKQRTFHTQTLSVTHFCGSVVAGWQQTGSHWRHQASGYCRQTPASPREPGSITSGGECVCVFVSLWTYACTLQ